MTFSQFNGGLFSKLRLPGIHRSVFQSQQVIEIKRKAPKSANHVIARNPVWTGQGRPGTSDRSSFVVEFTEINKEVLDALA